ncbi:hypothetical protein [Sanguibacter sp. HDW7]|uniref:hypothetical protein n=1 Tax=Sanguibacter sp. HDW7 TaxID=2714931 RepID=UPI001408C09F|nr:hypothetical protein [Sanguibacter sp. HDW7]QIK84437.1 hypothetical protein G7063_13045 [Sanguibacter sp. HDW7]
MNHDDRFTDALDAIAAAAGGTTTPLSDDELVAGVRRRAGVLRRRRATSRALVAAASTVVLGVAGWGLVDGLDDTTPPPPAGPASCGTTFTERLTTGPITIVGPDTDPEPPLVWALSAQIGIAALRNSTDAPVSFVASTQVGHVLVRDGVIVGATPSLGTATAENRLDPLTTSYTLTPSPMTLCTDAPLATGTYQIYAFTDVALDVADPRPARIWGEARTVHIGAPDPAAAALQLACGAPIDQLPWSFDPDGARLQAALRPPLRAHLARPAVRAGATLDAGLTVGVDGPALGRSAEVYLVRDGIIAAALGSDPTGAEWHTPGTDPDWPGIDEVALLDGPLRPTVPGTSCSTGEPLAPGDYDVVTVLPVAIGFQVEVSELVDAGRLTVVEGDVPAARPLAAPVCGEPVVAPERLVHNPAIKLDGVTSDRIDAPAHSVAGRDDRSLPVSLVATGRPARTLTWDSAVRPVLLRDGVVVAFGAEKPVDADPWQIDAAGSDHQSSVSFEVAAFEPCPGATLDAGEYTAWASLDTTLTVAGASRDVLVHGGPWQVSFAPVDPETTRVRYVPLCSEVLADVLPADAGDHFTLEPHASGTNADPLVARTSALEDGFWNPRMSLSAEDGADLVVRSTMLTVSRDGRVVLGHGTAVTQNVTLGETRELWANVALVGCDDEVLPAGTYDLTAVVSVEAPSGTVAVVRTWPLEIVDD